MDPLFASLERSVFSFFGDDGEFQSPVSIKTEPVDTPATDPSGDVQMTDASVLSTLEEHRKGADLFVQSTLDPKPQSAPMAKKQQQKKKNSSKKKEEHTIEDGNESTASSIQLQKKRNAASRRRRNTQQKRQKEEEGSEAVPMETAISDSDRSMASRHASPKSSPASSTKSTAQSKRKAKAKTKQKDKAKQKRETDSKTKAGSSGKKTDDFEPLKGVDTDFVKEAAKRQASVVPEILPVDEMMHRFPKTCGGFLFDREAEAAIAAEETGDASKDQGIKTETDRDGDTKMNDTTATGADRIDAKDGSSVKRRQKRPVSAAGKKPRGRSTTTDDVARLFPPEEYPGWVDRDDDEHGNEDQSGADEKRQQRPKADKGDAKGASSQSSPSSPMRIDSAEESENPRAIVSYEVIINEIAKVIPRTQLSLQMFGSPAEIEEACTSMMKAGRADLPDFTAEYEDMMLMEAGNFVLPGSGCGTLHFVPCCKGKECVGMTANAPLSEPGFAIKGQPEKRQCFTLMAFMYEHEWQEMKRQGVAPQSVREGRPCILCARKMIQTLALAIGIVHDRSGQVIENPKLGSSSSSDSKGDANSTAHTKKEFTADLLDVNRVWQWYQNKREVPGGYYANRMLAPQELPNSQIIRAPVVRFERHLLMAVFDSKANRWRIDQSAIKFKPSPLPPPDIGENHSLF